MRFALLKVLARIVPIVSLAFALISCGGPAPVAPGEFRTNDFTYPTTTSEFSFVHVVIIAERAAGIDFDNVSVQNVSLQWNSENVARVVIEGEAAGKYHVQIAAPAAKDGHLPFQVAISNGVGSASDTVSLTTLASALDRVGLHDLDDVGPSHSSLRVESDPRLFRDLQGLTIEEIGQSAARDYTLTVSSGLEHLEGTTRLDSLGPALGLFLWRLEATESAIQEGERPTTSVAHSQGSPTAYILVLSDD